MRLAEAPPPEQAAESRVRRFRASTEAVDSYNTVVKADGWKLERYSKNPVVLFGHASYSLPIGKGRAFVEGAELMLDVEFLSAEENPLAEQTLRIVDKGLMGASVGFKPLAEEYDESRETGDPWQDLFYPPLNYTEAELLEVSVVTIPANPETLPVGRQVAQQRFMARTAPKPAPAPEALSREVLGRLITEITQEETRAFFARRSGKLTGG